MTPKLAFDQLGHGSPIILVLGAFNTRADGAALATALAADHTVINYDRRGRGESEDEASYAVAREIEDLAVMLQHVGGAAGVFGFSSGAALALLAAARGLAITRLALFDLPLTAEPRTPDHSGALDALVREGRRGEAVEYFQRHLVGLPEPVIAQLRTAPSRPALEAIAHTLVYDAKIVGDGSVPSEQARAVRCPTLAIAAGAAHPIMREAIEAVARVVPDARTLVLEGAQHALDPAALAPPLCRFFAG